MNKLPDDFTGPFKDDDSVFWRGGERWAIFGFSTGFYTDVYSFEHMKEESQHRDDIKEYLTDYED